MRSLFGYDAQSLCFNPETKESLITLEAQIRKICDFRDMDAASIGYPAVSVDAVLAAHNKMIHDVFAASGLTDAQIHDLLLPTIRELVRTIHLIPASGGYHHKDCGGLFVHSLETAWAAAQKCKGHYFAINQNKPNVIETQREMLLAVILAALCHDAGKVLSDVVIRTEPGSGERFEPHADKLSEWMVKKGLKRYYVYWKGKGKDHETELINLYNDLIPKKTREYLGEKISFDLGNFFSGKAQLNGNSIIADIVSEADSESTGLDRRRGQFDRSHTALYDRECANFFTAVKRLLLLGASNKDDNGVAHPTKVKGVTVRGWTVNTPDPAILLTADGKCFIDWERFTEVRKIYQIERVNSSCFDTGTTLSTNEEFEENIFTPEDNALSMVEVLAAENYIVLNEGAGKYKSMKYFWRVGRYNVQDPAGSIIPFKAVCLSEEAAGKIFTEPKDAPREARIYATFSQKGNDEDAKPNLVFASEEDRANHEAVIARIEQEKQSEEVAAEEDKKPKDSVENKDAVAIPTRKEIEQAERKAKAEERKKKKLGRENAEDKIVDVDGKRYAVSGDGDMTEIQDDEEVTSDNQQEDSRVNPKENDNETTVQHDATDGDNDSSSTENATTVDNAPTTKKDEGTFVRTVTFDDNPGEGETANATTSKIDFSGPAFDFNSKHKDKEEQANDGAVSKTRKKTDSDHGANRQKNSNSGGKNDIKGTRATEPQPRVREKQTEPVEQSVGQAEPESEEELQQQLQAELEQSEQGEQLPTTESQPKEATSKEQISLDFTMPDFGTKPEQKQSGQSTVSAKEQSPQTDEREKSGDGQSAADAGTKTGQQQISLDTGFFSKPSKKKKEPKEQKSQKIQTEPAIKEVKKPVQEEQHAETVKDDQGNAEIVNNDPPVPDQILTEDEEEALNSQQLPIRNSLHDKLSATAGINSTSEPQSPQKILKTLPPDTPLPFDNTEDFPMEGTEFLDALETSLEIGAASSEITLAIDPAKGYYFTNVQIESLARLVTKSAKARNTLLWMVRTCTRKSLSYDRLSGRLYLKGD